jgi:hypothetical protein
MKDKAMSTTAIQMPEDQRILRARLEQLDAERDALAARIAACEEQRGGAAGARSGFDEVRFLDSEAMIVGYLAQFGDDDPMAPKARAAAERARARLLRMSEIDKLTQRIRSAEYAFGMEASEVFTAAQKNPEQAGGTFRERDERRARPREFARLC